MSLHNMDTRIIVQLISSGGIIVAALLSVILGYVLYSRALTVRMTLKRESDLFKEALFYRMVMERYRTFHAEQKPESKIAYREYWDEVREELGFAPTLTQPAKTMTRLKELESLTKEAEIALEHLKRTVKS